MENQKKFEGQPEGEAIQVGIDGNIEKSSMPMTAQMIKCDPSLQQEKDDAELLINIGDSYSRVQKGTIFSADGETKIPVDLTFIRTRNEGGGVDVICQIPALGMLPEAPLG